MDSLCRRLRATAEAVDAGGEGTLDGRSPGAGKRAFTSENTVRSTGVDPLVGPYEPNDDPSAVKEECPQQRCLRQELPVDTVVGGQGSPVPTTAKKMFSVVSPWDGDTVSLDESQNRQAIQALPLLRRRPAGRKTGEDLFRLDKTILKVGARVAWGRLHRARFAKVRYFTPVLRRDYTQAASIRINHSLHGRGYTQAYRSKFPYARVFIGRIDRRLNRVRSCLLRAILGGPDADAFHGEPGERLSRLGLCRDQQQPHGRPHAERVLGVPGD